MSKAVLDELEAGGQELIERLVYFAQRRAGMLTWCDGRSGDSLPGGKTAEDIVFILLEKLLTGGLSWDPGRVKFEFFMRGAIFRDMGHLVNSKGHRAELRIPEEEHRADALLENNCVDGPEDQLLREAHDADFQARFYRAVEGDEELENLLLLLDDGIGDTKSIADALKIPARRVYTLRDKLFNRIQSTSASMKRDERAEK